jgi:hypothetical protein
MRGAAWISEVFKRWILGKRMAEETVKSFTVLCRKYVAEI